jgi:hypothetical protein
MARRNAFAKMLLPALALAATHVRDASACGGCFHPPTQVATDITDERMLLAVSPTQSTLYDQIRYSGNPTSFAWVLPIHGTVDVGLSADVLFDSIDVLTATRIVPPESNCAPPQQCGSLFGSKSVPQASGFDLGAAGPPPVVVTKQENVGPYDTVQLHSTDAGALEKWLAQNGFVIPPDVQPVINAYVGEGFDFLAMKLLPGQNVQAMRPVRVTTQGASLSLPMRMASVGTGVTVGITIWVVADGRFEPQNYPSFRIDEKALVWDWSTSLSNYTTLRAQHEASLSGAGWEIESSLALNEQTIINLVLSGGQNNGGGLSSVAPSEAAQDYLPAGDPDAGADAGAYQSAEDVRAADLATLFAGIAGPTVRVSRMRGDIAHAAMTKDLVLQASADQTELSNVRTVTNSVNLHCPQGPSCFLGCAASPTSPLSRGSLAASIAAGFGLLGVAAARARQWRRRR